MIKSHVHYFHVDACTALVENKDGRSHSGIEKEWHGYQS